MFRKLQEKNGNYRGRMFSFYSFHFKTLKLTAQWKAIMWQQAFDTRNWASFLKIQSFRTQVQTILNKRYQQVSITIYRAEATLRIFTK